MAATGGAPLGTARCACTNFVWHGAFRHSGIGVPHEIATAGTDPAIDREEA